MTTVARQPASVTAEEFETLPDTKGYELIDGVLVEKNMGALSALVGMYVGELLSAHCRRTGAGWVFGPEGGYRCFPDLPNRVRKPDVSFVSATRMSVDQIPKGYPKLAPDLVVEVSSPNDRVDELEEKAEQFLAAGVRRVWIVNPETRTVRILRPDGSDTRLHADDELTGEDVLPGFNCKVSELFPKQAGSNRP